MEFHFIATFDFCTQFCYDLSVHRNHTSRNKLISLTTRANACISQELVQTNRFIGIDKLLLVFNLFLLTILGIRIVVSRTWALWTAVCIVSSTIVATTSIRIETRTLRTISLIAIRALYETTLLARRVRIETQTLRTIAISTLTTFRIRIEARTLRTITTFGIETGTIRTFPTIRTL